jgi:hypothetical protein
MVYFSFCRVRTVAQFEGRSRMSDVGGPQSKVQGPRSKGRSRRSEVGGGAHGSAVAKAMADEMADKVTRSTSRSRVAECHSAIQQSATLRYISSP